MSWRFGAYICANTLPVQDLTMDVSCEITYRLSAGACREQLLLLEGMQIAPPREASWSCIDAYLWPQPTCVLLKLLDSMPIRVLDDVSKL